jgi:hypothetical protein
MYHMCGTKLIYLRARVCGITLVETLVTLTLGLAVVSVASTCTPATRIVLSRQKEWPACKSLHAWRPRC